jgi:hypothetical protein
MSAKRPAKKGVAAKAAPSVVFKFDDETHALSTVEVERQLQKQYHAMANSDHPELRAQGRKRLLDTAKRAARDAARQEGTKKERRPDITEWISSQLGRDSAIKASELWSRAPEWITEQLGFDRFRKRVSTARKVAASK